MREAACIHHYETRGQHDPWHTYNPPYAGGFQFTLATWNEPQNGKPYPSLLAVSRAPVAEQMRRAYIVWQRGHTWRNDWPNTARVCGAS
jgi:hypothetical protein